LLAVLLELAPGLTGRERQPADLGLTDGVLAAGMSGEFAPGHSGQGRAGQSGPGGLAVGVVTGEQQGMQPAGLRGGGYGDLLATGKV
jgi:hypothetical protein